MAGVDPQPIAKPPPCSQTMTGLFAESAAGVHTFRTRQSSLTLSAEGSASNIWPKRVEGSGRSALRSCGQIGPKASASRVPAHASALRDGQKREGLVGGAP